MPLTKKLLFVLTATLFSIQAINAQFDYTPGYTAGKPEQMNTLSFLEGKWEIDLYYPKIENGEKQWVKYGKTESKFSSVFEGTFIKESGQGFPINPPHDGFYHWSYDGYYSYDRFNKVFRTIFFDNLIGFADIYEGNFENGNLIMTNLNTQTHIKQGPNGTFIKTTFTIEEIKEDSFYLYWGNVEEEKAKGKSYKDVKWNFNVKMRFKRSK